MIALFFVVLLVLFVLAVPIGISMLGSSLIFLITGGYKLLSIPQFMMDGINSFPLLAVPGFILMGELMTRCGMAERLINVAMIIVGRVNGGLAHVAIVGEMFISGISGSSVADSAAVGSVLLPSMNKRGYSPAFSAAVIATAGTMGPIIPPSIGMVVLGSMTNVSVGRLFLAGAIPGIIMGLYAMVVIYFVVRKRNYGKEEIGFTWREFFKRIEAALLALLAPVFIIGGILLGIVTPTEVSITGVVFVLLVGKFLYKTLPAKEIWESLRSTVYGTGSIFFILAAAKVFGWVLAVEQFDILFANSLRAISSNPTVTMFIISGFLLLLGCVVETLALIILLSPILFPVVISYGIDPIHFGMVFMMNMTIGLLTPPVGLCMFVSCSLANVTIDEFTKEVWPFLVAVVAALLVVIVYPPVSTWLPYLLMPIGR